MHGGCVIEHHPNRKQTTPCDLKAKDKAANRCHEAKRVTTDAIFWSTSKAFLEKIKANVELQNAIRKAADVDAIVVIAQAEKFTVTAENFQKAQSVADQILKGNRRTVSKLRTSSSKHESGSPRFIDLNFKKESVVEIYIDQSTIEEQCSRFISSGIRCIYRQLATDKARTRITKRCDEGARLRANSLPPISTSN